MSTNSKKLFFAAVDILGKENLIFLLHGHLLLNNIKPNKYISIMSNNRYTNKINTEYQIPVESPKHNFMSQNKNRMQGDII